MPLLYRLDLVGAVIAVIGEQSMNLIEVAAVPTSQMRAEVIIDEVDEQAIHSGALELVVEEPGRRMAIRVIEAPDLDVLIHNDELFDAELVIEELHRVQHMERHHVIDVVTGGPSLSSHLDFFITQLEEGCAR